MIQPSRRMMAFTAIVAVAAIALVLVLFRSDRLTLAGALCAAAAMLVAMVPTVQRILSDEVGPLPILPLAALFYVPFFALPPLLLDIIWPPGHPIQIYLDAHIVPGIDANSTAVLLCGVIALVIGMTASRFVPATKSVRLPPSSPRRLALLGYGLMAFHAAFWLYPPLASIASMGQLLRPTGLLAGSVTLAALLAGGFRPLEAAVILGILLPLRLAAGLLTGSLNNTLVFVACLAIVMVSLRRRALVPMAAAVMIGVCLYTPVQIFRTVTWTPDQARVSLPERIDRFVSYVKMQISDPNGLWGDHSWKFHPYGSSLGVMAWPVLKRFDQATVLATVVERTPEEIPPWNGYSLKNLLTASIPRVLWPNKPEERFGNEFGRRYNFLWQSNFDMSVNLPWLTEFYVNFLYPGVIVGMFLTGLGMGVLDRLLNRPGANSLETAFAATLLVPLLIPESNISLMIGNLPLIGVVLWVLLRVGSGAVVWTKRPL